jgi:ribonuclease HI
MKPMKKEVVIHTDGACEGNPGPGGFAAVIDDDDGRREITGGAQQTTNNRMELTAVIRGLAALEEPSRVRVVTDSQYVVYGMTRWIRGWQRKGWRNASGAPVKNRDLWEELDALANKHQVRWEWIRGHVGHPENERADFLARQAIQEL